MLERSGLVPAINSSDPLSIEDITAHLRLWRADTAATAARLATLKARVEEHAKQLENPNAAVEYLDFFQGMLHRFGDELDRVAGELQTAAPRPEQLDALRQIASNAAVEQRRTLIFRDKWINKPLPYESMRSLLTEIAVEVRDQLADYRDLTAAAARLAQLSAPPPKDNEEEGRGFDRRALFTRLIRPESAGSPGNDE